jgi:ATP-dependent exoDNAse (exonuclease V) alpha subunit
LVVVDEVSLLSCDSFERILKLWSVAGKVPALVFLGDKYQLPGVEPTRPWESAAWKQPRCFHVKLTETWRCKEERFQEILDELRTDKPSKETFRKIVRDHKAWKSRGDPTPAEMKKLFEKHPDTRIVTCTRRGAAAVNEAAVAALYGRKTPLATLDGDVELNPENYLDGKLRTDRRLVPSKVPIYKGMKLYLTKNKNKEADEVNGMLCEVENYHAEEDMLRVMTKTGHRLAITRWTDREKGNAVYFPIRLGYASTIDKVQGDEFPHITIYLDGWPRPAAGYTALSRVATSDDYLIGGYVERDNFIPAF